MDWLHNDTWRVPHIQSEFADDFDALAEIPPTVVVYGSARLPGDSPYYQWGFDLSRALAKAGYAAITGGGSGIMEAANRSCYDADGLPIELDIELPHEQHLNDQVDLGMNFRYFFVRKTTSLKCSRAFICLLGDFGTLDELFESLVMVQTEKVENHPIMLLGTKFWPGLVDWIREKLVAMELISPTDMNLFLVTNFIEEAVEYIEAAHGKLMEECEPTSDAHEKLRRVRHFSEKQDAVRSFYQDSAVPTVMAIVNHIPDSFYNRGTTAAEEAALTHVDEVIAAGTDTVDVGGVKAGIGTEVTVTEEIRRVVPTIAKVRERYPELYISVDTWRAEVGEAATGAGANLINGTWAGHDPELLEVTGAHGTGYVCSHTGEALPHTNPIHVCYDGVVDGVISRTGKFIQRAMDAGVPEDRILTGPTHDFGESTYHDLELLRHCNELVVTGWPVLVALSNRNFVGETLDRPIEQRVSDTLATTTHTAAASAAVFRSHQASETLDVCRMTLATSGDFAPLHPVYRLM